MSEFPPSQKFQLQRFNSQRNSSQLQQMRYNLQDERSALMQELQDQKSNEIQSLKQYSQSLRSDQQMLRQRFTPIIGREVDREINQMEINQKVRDLETMMIDFKANIERRITKTIEENPQKFMQIFKVSIEFTTKQLEEKETQLWKQNFDKHHTVTEQMQMLKEGNRRQIEQMNSALLDMQKKVDEAEYKINRIEKENQTIAMKYGAVVLSSNQKALTNGESSLQGQGASNMELMILRDAFNQEKLQRESLYQDLLKLYQETNSRLMKQENEFFSKLKSQRDELMEQHQITKQQIKGLDSLKLQQINKDQDYLKMLIGSVDQKIAEEVDKRLRNEFENKNLLEQKFHNFKEEIRNDEKQILQGEQKFMRQVQESLGSLNQIIKNTREQLEAQMAASQTIVAENIKSLSNTIDVIKEGTHTKLQLLETAQRELNFRLSETRQMFHDHANLINETLQREFQRQEQSRLTFEDKVNKDIESQNNNFTNLQTQNEEWKINFERKNLQVFTEVSNALKNLRNDLVKEKKENTERFALLKTELSQQKEYFDDLIKNLNNHVAQLEKQITFQFDEIRKELKEHVNNVKMQLQLQIEAAIKQAIESSKVYCDKQIHNLEDKIIQRIAEESKNLRIEMKEKIEESEDRIRNHIADREKIIYEHIQKLIDEEKEERRRLKELIEKYADIVEKLKEELFAEVKKVRETLETQLNQAIQQLQLEINEKIAEVNRFLKAELLNIELRLNKKIEESLEMMKQQIDSLREFIKQVDKNLRSLIEQQIEQTKFELKALIKQVEADMFKLQVWVMKQIELMNHAMQDIHLQVQAEIYMEKMFMATQMELFQDHVQGIMENERNERLEWQDEERKTRISWQNGIQKNMEILREYMQTVETQLKELIQTIENQLQKDLQDAIQQVRFEIGESLTELEGQVKQVYNYFESKMYLENMLRQAQAQLDKESQAGLVSKVNKLVDQLERVEIKSNRIATDLDNFVNASETNFQLLQEAIKSHMTFLNELDAAQFSADLMNKAAFEDIHQSLSEMYEASKTGFDTLNRDLEKSLKEIQQGFEQLSEQIDQKVDSSGKEIETLQNKLADQKVQLEGRLQLLQSMVRLMEKTLSDQQQESTNQVILLVQDSNNLMLQNLQVSEKNMQNVLGAELNKIYDWQNEFSTKLAEQFTNIASDDEISGIRETQQKLIDDYNTLTKELEENFNLVRQNMGQLDTKVADLDLLDKKRDSEQDRKISELQAEINSKFAVLDQTQQLKDQEKEVRKNDKQVQKIQRKEEKDQQKTADQQAIMVLQSENVQIKHQLDEVMQRMSAGGQQGQVINEGIQQQVNQLSQTVDAQGQAINLLKAQLNDELDKVQLQLDQKKQTPSQTPLNQSKEEDHNKLKDLENNVNEMAQQLEKVLGENEERLSKLEGNMAQIENDIQGLQASQKK